MKKNTTIWKKIEIKEMQTKEFNAKQVDAIAFRFKQNMIMT